MTEGFQVQSQASAGIFPGARRGQTNAFHPSGVGKIGSASQAQRVELKMSKGIPVAERPRQANKKKGDKVAWPLLVQSGVMIFGFLEDGDS